MTEEVIQERINLNNEISKKLTSPDVGYPYVIIESVDASSISLRLHLPLAPIKPLFEEMLKFGYVCVGHWEQAHRDVVQFNKIDCDIAMDCLTNGRLICRAKTYKLVESTPAQMSPKA